MVVCVPKAVAEVLPIVQQEHLCGAVSTLRDSAEQDHLTLTAVLSVIMAVLQLLAVLMRLGEM
jgi:hypothetical protein